MLFHLLYPLSRYAALRDLGAAGLAKLVRIGLPGVGDSGEKLTAALLSAGIQVGAEQAARLRRSADDFVQARLDPKHYDIYRRPNETLARALATGLKQVSRSKPLVLLLDTYEIIERTDPWLRVAIKNAGPRVVWVISGRHNLAPSRPTDRFVGYSAEFPRRLSTWDIQELAIKYVLEYLRARVPQRKTARQDAEAIHRATLGVPLAMQAAAYLWARGVPLEAITEGIPDRAPRDEIVRLLYRGMATPSRGVATSPSGPSVASALGCRSMAPSTRSSPGRRWRRGSSGSSLSTGRSERISPSPSSSSRACRAIRRATSMRSCVRR